MGGTDRGPAVFGQRVEVSPKVSRWADQVESVVLAVAAPPARLMISRELAGLVDAEGCDLGRADVITGLGFAVVGAGPGVLLLAGSAFGLLSPDGVLHPVITMPAVPSAPARSVRRSTAPSSRPISIPQVRRPPMALTHQANHADSSRQPGGW